MIKIKSNAKINLCLNILGVTDGYHDLESLVTTVGICDTIRVKKRKDKKINVRMKGINLDIPIEKNNAYKAIKLFMDTFGTCGADVEITKRIAIGGGLGGSSADSAGALRAMAKLYKIDADLKVLAEKLGSDTAYQTCGGLAVLRGRGNDLELLPNPPKMPILIAVAEGGVDTGKCYEAADRLAKTPPADVEELIADVYSLNYENLGKNCVNGLFTAAKTINGEVGRIYDEIEKFSPSALSMTGSGSAVFAVFMSEKLCDKAVSELKKSGINAFKTYTVRRYK